MSTIRRTCPSCGAELTYDSGKAGHAAGGAKGCPYDGLRYAALRAGHDRIYFGKWRAIEGTWLDVRRGYNQLGRHLGAVGKALEGMDLPAARRDLEKALEAYRAADPEDEGPETIRFMDHALSFAHRVINDLLHEEGLPPHHPMDFAEWYDVVEIPFRDEW